MSTPPPSAPAPGGTQAEAAPPEAGPQAVGPTLFLVLRGDSPFAGTQAFDLAGVRELVIGRGGALALMPAGAPDAARLELPDPTVSGRHARLLMSATEAWLEDLGSRNGTRHSAGTNTRAKLDPGAWFVIGRSVFMLDARRHMVGIEPYVWGGASGQLSTFVPQTARTYVTAHNLATSRVPLLLVAETGTGKEVLAKEIHQLSQRKGAFVPVNCAALPQTLVESELFGYRRGAFSEAKEDRIGLIRAADGGTLLLDEVAELPLASQAKLLRVLQEGEVLPLGATRAVPVDVRVIAATQPRLDQAVNAGAFRADLLGRLAGYTLRLTPLRERLIDLGLLVAQILQRYAPNNASNLRFTSEACVALFRRKWPLNIRELDQCLQAALVLARNKGEIDVADLGEETVLSPPPAPQGEELKLVLHESLKRHQGNISAVAREMGKARMQIHRWMERFDLSPEQFRDGGTDS